MTECIRIYCPLWKCNSEAYMKKCIESLLPGGEDVEIIIVDDGSTDRTGAIADEYSVFLSALFLIDKIADQHVQNSISACKFPVRILWRLKGVLFRDGRPGIRRRRNERKMKLLSLRFPDEWL